MAITAVVEDVSVTVTPSRPSWADMVANYPDESVDTPTLYDTKISGLFKGLYKAPGYQNTCAVRMSYALNRSGIKLSKTKSSVASVLGGDGFWYWLRVGDLKAELSNRFKGFDEELVLDVIPDSLVADKALFDKAFLERVKKAKEFIDDKILDRNGIIVFEVVGWEDASGHFTLWDGASEKLLYAAPHNNPSDYLYYFWFTKIITKDKKQIVQQVVKIKFWELI